MQAIARELFGAGEMPGVTTNKAGGAAVLLPTGMAGLVPQVVDSLVGRDAVCSDPKAPVKVTHRRVDGHDVYFAINDSDVPWSGALLFCGNGVSERWDPATGATTPLADGAKVPLQLGPYGAMLFRAESVAAPARLGGAAASGLTMSAEPLPAAKVTTGGGQYVRSELAGDDASGWRAKGTLTKGGVDTHQFTSFTYGEPPALAQAAGLVIDSAVPEGQRTPAELLVFVATKDGGNFIASTGRFLNAPGKARAYVMFSQFRPFNSAKKSGALLDLSQVAAIRVGWGGYFGAEGEEVAVTVMPPQRFVCGAQ
mgnify:CR=1 FL=1